MMVVNSQLIRKYFADFPNESTEPYFQTANSIYVFREFDVLQLRKIRSHILTLTLHF